MHAVGEFNRMMDQFPNTIMWLVAQSALILIRRCKLWGKCRMHEPCSVRKKCDWRDWTQQGPDPCHWQCHEPSRRKEETRREKNSSAFMMIQTILFPIESHSCFLFQDLVCFWKSFFIKNEKKKRAQSPWSSILE